MDEKRSRRGRGAPDDRRERERPANRGPEQEEDRQREDLVFGRNAVQELLRSGRPVESLLVANGEGKGNVAHLIAQARELGLPVKEVSPVKLDHLCGGQVHQGVAAIAAAAQYVTLDELFERAGEEAPFFLIADDIEDPHNLGALIRTAEAAGAHGLILPKRGGVGLTATVAKTSAGAVAHLPVARVSNLAAAVEELKKRGVWIYGADMSGADWSTVDYSGPAALIVGSEGRGMSRLLREKCDFVVSLPMRGKVNSLNASVAAGIVMYEIARQRLAGPRR